MSLKPAGRLENLSPTGFYRPLMSDKCLIWNIIGNLWRIEREVGGANVVGNTVRFLG